MDDDTQLGGMLTDWMEATAPTRLPLRTLDATFERTRGSRQEAGWRSRLRGPSIAWSAPALSGAMVIVIATALAVTALIIQPRAGAPARLPASPDDWTRVELDVPPGTVIDSLAAGPRGLLAVILEREGDGPTRLMVSTDGRLWATVQGDRNPFASPAYLLGAPSVAGTDRGFLLMKGDEVWESETGVEWRKLADATTDPDLDMRSMTAAVTGGPGIVAVGSDPTAWSSTDGTDWSPAEVPPLPAAILEIPDAERSAELTGVTASGERLVAWGTVEARTDDESTVEPILWASDDGRTWTDVADPRMETVTDITGGPDGFVAVGRVGTDPGLWFSSDGRAWEPVAMDAFESRWPKGSDGLRINDDPGDIPIELRLEAAAAGSAGYIVAGGDGMCVGEGFCASDETAIWTSTDGRSWTRVPFGSRYPSGSATDAVAWGSGFVVGGINDHGAVDRGAVVWISTP